MKRLILVTSLFLLSTSVNSQSLNLQQSEQIAQQVQALQAAQALANQKLALAEKLDEENSGDKASEVQKGLWGKVKALFPVFNPTTVKGTFEDAKKYQENSTKRAAELNKVIEDI